MNSKHFVDESDHIAKWKCQSCGRTYGHNPDECAVCEHTVFDPILSTESDETFEQGEMTTKLGADVSELAKQAGGEVKTDQSEHSELRQPEETDNPNSLSCPNCGSSTDRLAKCDDCATSLCPSCVHNHACQRENDSNTGSVISRLLNLFNR